MSKLNLPDIGTLANSSSARQGINDNFGRIEDAINNTISRDGTTPNSMEADLDLNSHKVINVADPEADLDAVNRRSIGPIVSDYISEIAQTIVAGTARVDRFIATAGQTAFTLTDSPGTSKNTFVTDTGVLLIPDVDYTLAGSDLKTLTFNTGRAAGSEIVARYTQLAPSDGALRADLVSTTSGKGAELISYTSVEGDVGTVASYLDGISRAPLADLVYQREIVAEIPFWTEETEYLQGLYGNDPYPYGFAFDGETDELFVALHANAVTGTAFFVYDVKADSRTWPLKTVFYTGEFGCESFVIRYVGATRYLYGLKYPGGAVGDSIVYRADITTLPGKYGFTPAVENFPDVQGYSQLAFDGNTFAVQCRRSFKGHTLRYVYDLWDADLANKIGVVDFTQAVGGTLTAPYNELRQKTQGTCIWNGHYVFSAGGDYVTGTHDPDDAYLHQGIIICGADGRRIAGGLCRPDKFIEVRDTSANGLSYSGNMVESEGVSTYKGDLYALWVCTSPGPAQDEPARAGQGFIITREMSTSDKRIDFRSAARIVPTWDPERYGTVLHQPVGAPVNPITNESMDTFAKICTFMKDAALSKFTFYGSGSLTDLNSVSVDVNATFVEVLNGNGSTFLITIKSLTTGKNRVFWISGGITVQTDLSPVDSGWNTATLQNSWVAFGGNSATPSYRKIGSRVQLRGAAKNGTATSNTTLFTLPTGYRPPYDMQFPISNANSPTNDTLILIDTFGLVRLYGPVSNAFVSIDNISFLVD